MIETFSITLKLSSGQEITLTEKEMAELKDKLYQLLAPIKIYYPYYPTYYPMEAPIVTYGDSGGIGRNFAHG